MVKGFKKKNSKGGHDFIPTEKKTTRNAGDVDVEVDVNVKELDDFVKDKKENFENQKERKIHLRDDTEKFPHVLTLDQFDNQKGFEKSKQFGLDDDRPENDIERDVIDYAEKTHGVIYTQVDTDNGERGYVRGLRLVNRTGIFEVVPNAYDNNGYLLN